MLKVFQPGPFLSLFLFDAQEVGAGVSRAGFGRRAAGGGEVAMNAGPAARLDHAAGADGLFGVEPGDIGQFGRGGVGFEQDLARSLKVEVGMGRRSGADPGRAAR